MKFLISTIISAAVFCSPLYADSKLPKRGSLDLLVRLCTDMLSFPHPVLESYYKLTRDENLPPEVKNPAVRTFLQTDALKALEFSIDLGRHTDSPELLLRLGQKVTVNQSEGVVVAFLGTGAEADVYLVRTSLGLKSLKVFRSSEQRESCVQGLLRLEEVGSTIAKIENVDETQNYVLSEYVEGLTIQDIEDNGERLGLSRSQIKQILKGYRVWLKTPGGRAYKASSKANPKVNVLYDFNNNRYVVIDAV